MTIEVRIPPRLQRNARRLGKERNRPKEEREGFDNDADSWGKSPLDRNIMGVLGEMAFAIHYDLHLDPTQYHTSDDGYDFEAIHNGEPMTIDVKTTRYDPQYLQIKKKELTADYYVLIQLRSDEEAILHGGATAESVASAPVKESPKYGHENYVIPVDKLADLPDTLERVDTTPSGARPHGGPQSGPDRISW